MIIFARYEEDSVYQHSLYPTVVFLWAEKSGNRKENESQ